jgi:hypothetical protein
MNKLNGFDVFSTTPKGLQKTTPKGIQKGIQKYTKMDPNMYRKSIEKCNTAAWRRFCNVFLNLACKKRTIYIVKVPNLKKRSKPATISHSFFTFTI